MMDKHGTQAIKDFTLAAYNKFGMRVVIFAAFLHKGKPAISMWVLFSIHTHISPFQIASITIEITGGNHSRPTIKNGSAAK